MGPKERELKTLVVHLFRDESLLKISEREKIMLHFREPERCSQHKPEIDQLDSIDRQYSDKSCSTAEDKSYLLDD